MGLPDPTLDAVFPYFFPPFFICLWLGISAFLRNLGGFSWKTSRDFRDVKRMASAYFCSGRIAGINFASALHIHRVEGGFLLQIPRIFHGGSRYIPDSDIIKHKESNALFGGAVIDATIGSTLFRLTGKGAEFFMKHAVLPNRLTSH